MISSDLLLNWTDLNDLRKKARQLNRLFKDESAKISSVVNRQTFRENLPSGVFYVPLQVSWRKKVDAESILNSVSISDKRKKIVRQAISQSEKLGIKYEIVNPLNTNDFQLFLDYYRKYNQEMGFDLYLDESYLQKYSPEQLFLIKIIDAEGKFMGGRLVKIADGKITTDFRAIERTKLVKEGYDTVCEKIYYDLAVKYHSPLMTRGVELNIKGFANRSIGLLWNKLKWGYAPFIFSVFPRVYQDFSFVKSLEFDQIFFISIENNGASTREYEKLNFNFVCGKSPDWAEIKSVKEKSMLPVKIWNMDFEEIQIPN